MRSDLFPIAHPLGAPHHGRMRRGVSLRLTGHLAPPRPHLVISPLLHQYGTQASNLAPGGRTPGVPGWIPLQVARPVHPRAVGSSKLAWPAGELGLCRDDLPLRLV